jgi:protein-tyrosine kinase
MGRLDNVLRRVNLDVKEGTGAAAPDGDSPWTFDAPDTPMEQGVGPGVGRDVGPGVGRVFRPATGDAGRPAGGTNGDAAKPSPKPVLRRPARRDASRLFDSDAARRLVAADGAPPLQVEQFRGLAATLHQAQLQQPIKSVIVTSPSPGDGKSHVAVNLALTLCDSYNRQVLLIDADLRRPSLHQLLHVENTEGLSEALHSEPGGVATVAITDRLTLLPAGRPNDNPLAALASDRMKHIVADAAAHFDWVIVDAPPVGLLADARLVSETVDAALLVIRAGITQYADVEAAADMLGHERILGLVLNAVDPAEIRGEDYYYRYYRSDSADRR